MNSFKLKIILIFMCLAQIGLASGPQFFASKEPYKEAEAQFLKTLRKVYPSCSSLSLTRNAMEDELSCELHALLRAKNFTFPAIEELCAASGLKYHKILLNKERQQYSSSDACFTKTVLAKTITKYKLSALHLAVALQDQTAIEWLVSKGADLFAPDKNKWTPAHFAALHESDAILKVMENLGDKFEKRDVNQANAQELWQSTHFESPENQSINVWDEETQSVKQVDGHEYFQLTKAHFSSVIRINPKILVQEWALFFVDKDPLKVQLANNKQYKNFRKTYLAKKAPYEDVYIKEIPNPLQKDFKVATKSSLGFGLYAAADFAEGAIIGDYAGEWIGQKPLAERSEYSTQNIDCTDIRGYICFAADGAPNVALYAIWNAKGVKIAEILYALRPIAKDEPILWHYGSHNIKWERYLEIAPEKVDEFLAVNSLGALIDAGVKSYDQLIMLNYIVETPVVLTRLVAESKVSRHDLEKIVEAQSLGIVEERNLRFYLPELIDMLKFTENLKLSERRIVFDFIRNKAVDGNVQVLISFIKNLEETLRYTKKVGLRLDTRILESSWQRIWKGFCQKYSDRGNRGNCRELRADLVDDEL